MSAALSPTNDHDELFYVGRSLVANDALPELSRVVLRSEVLDNDGRPLPPGLIGTIVCVLGGGSAYDVEFISPVAALATVRAHEIGRVDG